MPGFDQEADGTVRIDVCLVCSAVGKLDGMTTVRVAPGTGKVRVRL